MKKTKRKSRAASARQKAALRRLRRVGVGSAGVLNRTKAFLKRCGVRLSRSVGTLEAQRICGTIAERKVLRSAKKTKPGGQTHYAVYYNEGMRPKSYQGPFTRAEAQAWIKADRTRYPGTPSKRYKIWNRKPW